MPAPSSPRQSRATGRWLRVLAGTGVTSVALLIGGAAVAQANYPGPPPELREEAESGVLPFGAYENAPAQCPDTAPKGTVMTATPVRQVCEEAVAKAPTPEAAAAIRYAFSKLGSPYSQSQRHSISPPIFDCSSFIARAYDAADGAIYRNGQRLNWFRPDYTLSWTGAYMPTAYQGSNVIRLNSISELQPGDILIQFDGANPANSAGNGGHAQMWLGNDLVIQSGGDHRDSLVNVSRHNNWFNNEWYFRYTSTPEISPIFRTWSALGGSTGLAGPAVASTEQIGNGFLMRRYEKAWIYWSAPTGTAVVNGPALSRYTEIGAHGGVLGPAVADEAATAVAGTVVNKFSAGAIYTSAVAGANEVYGAIGQRYFGLGADRSVLGVPNLREQAGPLPGSVEQRFNTGRIYYAAATGAHPVIGAIHSRYRTGPVASRIGLPTQAATAIPGGSFQKFQRGRIYSSTATGTHEVYGAIYQRYVQLGAEESRLGLPISVEQPGTKPGSAVQNFQGGTISWTPTTGAIESIGGADAANRKAVAEAAGLGRATSGEVAGPVAGAYMQSYEGGTLIWSEATGTRALVGDLARSYFASSLYRAIGIPIENARPGGVPGSKVQNFTSGRMYYSAGTGAHAVWGAILDRYLRMGGETSAAGLPTSSEVTAGPANTRKNTFTGGAIYWSPTTGAHEVLGDFAAKFRAIGGANSGLGLPSGAVAAISGGTTQPFGHGKIYSTRYGIHEVYGGIYYAYRNMGAHTSPIGVPRTGEIAGPVAGSRQSQFSGGAIYWSPTTGAHEVYGAIGARYLNNQLWSVLGLPVTGEIAGRVPGSRLNQFAGGGIYWSPATGAHEVYGAIGITYRQLGAEASRLGLPTTGEYSTATGRANDFVNGRITWNSRTGAISVTTK